MEILAVNNESFFPWDIVRLKKVFFINLMNMLGKNLICK